MIRPAFTAFLASSLLSFSPMPVSAAVPSEPADCAEPADPADPATCDAATASDRSRLAVALAGVDNPITPTTLRVIAGEGVEAQLVALACDGDADGHVRLRAAAALSSLSTQPALRALIRLAARASLPQRLRWHAVYGAVVRGGADAAALRRLDRWLRSPSASVREAAVRGARHLPAAAAGHRLRRCLRDVDDAVVAAARHGLARHGLARHGLARDGLARGATLPAVRDGKTRRIERKAPHRSGRPK